MSDLIFFDAFTQIGPRVKKHPVHAWKLSELLAEMDHCSISGALVASTLSVSYEPLHSNLELSAQLAPHKHLFAIWNVFPHQTGEFPDPAKLETLMRDHDVRAVSIFPKTNAWDWNADHSQELFRFLARRRVLTILDRNEFGDWGVLDAFLGRHRRLPLLVVHTRWDEQRFLLPLLQKHRNLHICFDHFQINYGLEYLVGIGCEDQLLYASNAPLMSMGAHRCYVDYADVPLAAREKIAGGNLTRLLHGQRPPRLRVNRDEDIIMAAARQGRPLPVPLIDMHMHILSENMNGAGGAHRMDRGGPRGTFALQKRLGYSGGGFMSWNVVSGDSLAGNATVKETLDAAPRGYWGLASFDPSHYSQSELKTLIPEVCRDKRFIGMKPYWVYGVEYHHRSYDVWWKHGNQHRFYALVHRTRGDFVEVDTLARKYPNVRWVVAHCGASFPVADSAIECMKKHPNVFAEITLTPVTFGVIDYLVEHAGEDRIIYGSDLPMRDPRQQLGWVVFSRLTLKQKMKVLAGNALKIIAPCAAQLPAYNRPDGTVLVGGKKRAAPAAHK
jgi:predicted TIM-barrel fold metal-dependent hydrolase